MDVDSPFTGQEIFYTELVGPGGYGPSDEIHVCPYGTDGSGGHDTRILPSPRPGTGIQDLVFYNNMLYVLTGQYNSPLEVFELNPTTGTIVIGPIPIASPASPGSDGFAVLPDGNFLINNDDGSPEYHEYDAITGSLVSSGFAINIFYSFGINGGAMGVALAPDGQSLYFALAYGQTIIQTDFARNLIGSYSIAATGIEDIGVIIPQ